MSISKMKEKLESLENAKFDLEFLVNSVNDKTREIKYDNTPMDIYLHVEALAEKNGIDVSYEVDAIRQKVNDLESAIYELVAPFEDKKRDIENEHDELEMEISDEEYSL